MYGVNAPTGACICQVSAQEVLSRRINW